MTQAERLTFLIEYLISENKELKSFHIPVEENARKRLLRSLMNIRPPKPVTKDFLNIQDEYLQVEKTEKGIISLADIPFVKSGIHLWQGDITHCMRSGWRERAAGYRLQHRSIPACL